MKNNFLFSHSNKSTLDLKLRTAVMLCSLLMITVSEHVYYNFSLVLVFAALMLVERVSKQRWILCGLFIANTLLVMFMAKSFLNNSATAYIQLSKTLASITALNWYGGTVSWPVFRGVFLKEGMLWSLGSMLDQGIFQGEVIIGSIEKRFQAAWIRIGKKSRNPKNVGRAIAGGLALSLERAHNIEDALSIRANPSSLCPQCIAVSNCSLGFKGNKNVLTDISFKLNKGDWMLVAGPSGSGKTSLLKLISGIVKPCKGCVSSGQGHVGFLFQNPDDQLFATTARQDIYWGLKERGVDHEKASKAVSYWLGKLGVEHLADRSLAKLSFGEKKRVALAGTLALEPSILLCDEPTAGLDYLASKNLINLLEEISLERSISVIWVTHDLINLPQKLSKTILLKDGQVVFYGNTNKALLPENLVSSGLR